MFNFTFDWFRGKLWHPSDKPEYKKFILTSWE